MSFARAVDSLQLALTPWDCCVFWATAAVALGVGLSDLLRGNKEPGRKMAVEVSPDECQGVWRGAERRGGLRWPACPLSDQSAMGHGAESD